MADHQAVGRPRYRRFVVAVSVMLGIALGLGVGSVAAMAGRWEFILILVLIVGFRVVAVARGNRGSFDPVVWVWPSVALVVTLATFFLLPPDVAPVGLGLAIAIWFVLIVVGGVLEIVLDPDGRLANTLE